MGTDISKYADQAMFRAVPTATEGEEVVPKVHFLGGTPDPLGAIAAASLMYQGLPVRSRTEVTDEQRTQIFEDTKKTRIDSAFEFVDLHFMIEGVTRAFTHQLVRQRTAVYVQESQRFAVKDNGASEVALPPSLHGTMSADEFDAWWREQARGTSMSEREAAEHYYYEEASREQKARIAWDRELESQMNTYNKMIDFGMPAEDARGLLPTNVTTRIHYKTNLRALLNHAGNRLCTQAQFEWRRVWLGNDGIMEAIRNYSTCPGHSYQDESLACQQGPHLCDNWQWAEISKMFRPVCYQTGKCEFMSSIDRHCVIRDRVEANHVAGVPSSEWHKDRGLGRVLPILPQEWMADPTAARKR